MSNPVWMRAYAASPLIYLNKGILSFFAMILALLQCYVFYNAFNKNIDGLINTLGSFINATLSTTATVGGIVSAALGVAFAAGLWLVLAGLVLALCNQLLEFALQLFRSYEAPEGTALRKHYQQAAIHHLFMAAYVALTIAALVCTTLALVNPIGAALLCGAVVGLTLVHVAWRFTSADLKDKIKQRIRLNKPEKDRVLSPEPKIDLEKYPQHAKLFTSIDYVAQMRTGAPAQAKDFIEKKIREKLAEFKTQYGDLDCNPKIVLSNKIKSKREVLLHLQKVLEKEQTTGSADLLSKTEVADKYSGAFQSFLREKGDIERIYDGVDYYIRKINNPNSKTTDYVSEDSHEDPSPVIVDAAAFV